MLLLAQIVGIAAVTLYMFSFQLKKRRSMVLVTCVGNGLYMLQYLLLGAFSGAALDVLSAIASFFAAKKHSLSFRRFVRWGAFVTMLLMAGVGISLAAVQKDWMELLPVAGGLLQTGGLWFEKEQTIRLFALAGAPFWLVYNFVSMAYGAAVGSVLTIISAVVALIRYRNKQKNPNPEKAL